MVNETITETLNIRFQICPRSNEKLINLIINRLNMNNWNKKVAWFDYDVWSSWYKWCSSFK